MVLTRHTCHRMPFPLLYSEGTIGSELETERKRVYGVRLSSIGRFGTCRDTSSGTFLLELRDRLSVSL